MDTQLQESAPNRTLAHYEIPVFTSIVYTGARPAEAGVRRCLVSKIADDLVAEGKAIYA